MFNRYNRISVESWIFGIAMLALLTIIIRCTFIYGFFYNPDSYKRVINTDDFVYNADYEVKKATRAQEELVEEAYEFYGVDYEELEEFIGTSSISYTIDDYFTAEYIRHNAYDILVATMEPYYSFDSEFYFNFAKETLIPNISHGEQMDTNTEDRIAESFTLNNINTLRSVQFQNEGTSKADVRNIYVTIASVAAGVAFLAMVVFVLRSKSKFNGLTVSSLSIAFASLINLIWIAIERSRLHGIIMIIVLRRQYYILPMIIFAAVALVFSILAILFKIISDKVYDNY